MQADDDRCMYASFGRLLRFWRGVHKLSQEELAFALESSTRHISFLETGRARPGIELINKLARHFSLSQRDTKNLMLSAGFVPLQSKVDFNAPEVRWLRKMMVYTMRSLDPYPAIVMDRYGNIQMINKGWAAFIHNLLQSAELSHPTNFHHFLFSGAGLRPLLVDWVDTACVILMSLQQEILLNQDEQAQCLLDELLAYSGIPDDWALRASQLEAKTSFLLQLNIDGKIASFFDLTLTVGSSAYVPEPRLHVNVIYPESGSSIFESDDWKNFPEKDNPLLFY